MTQVLDRPEADSAGSGYRSLAKRVKEWVDQYPDEVVLREKDYGVWQEYTWAEFWDNVMLASHGLLALGVDKGDVVSIHSEDRPEWVILDIATTAIRAITTGLYPTNPTAEVLYLLNDSRARVH
ncbi:MAG: AMP-binding protein, partial [Acidimicrobiia bacterium]|nr:AMP-binding protein [Acidimicrobiia bacterium]